METTTAKEHLAKISIPVTGMTCASCVRRVERTLFKKEGVAEASVNFAAEKATVEYDPKATDPNEMIGAIEDAGYGADIRETSFGVTGMTCASCVGRVEYLAGEVEPRDLEKAVEGAGYGVVRGEESSAEDTREREHKKLRVDFLLAATLTALILFGSLPMMLGLEPPMPMVWLNLGLLVLATPVQ